MATINDVARLAGVSATTAKRAIRFPEKLAPDTLERVQKAIRELHYEPDKLASALRSGQSQTIGLIVGSIVEPFFAQLTRTIGQEVRAQGYTLITAENEYESELERKQLKEFYGNRISGLLIRSAFGKPNTDYLERMQERGIAIVEVDYFSPHSPFSHVMLDNPQCVNDGVDYLAKLGHRRIAALGSYHPTIQPDERVQTFPLAMQKLGLTIPEAYIGYLSPTQDAAYDFTHYLMNLPEPPTALFAITGNMAIGTFRALRELGLKIPQDVSLLSFDNYTWTELVDPPVDVIEQPNKEMARAATELLFEHIRDPNREIQHLRFKGKLIKRGSCAAPSELAPAR
ncbi:MAG: LacI family DNA-binding transcriptional regulator [Trueperaceae bacterium]|nr:LacI family DNA-binding transcriptional regulator [Trueperaceae bacterium]